MQFYMHTFDCSKTDYSTKKSSLLCDFSFKATNKFHIMWPWISVILGKNHKKNIDNQYLDLFIQVVVVTACKV